MGGESQRPFVLCSDSKVLCVHVFFALASCLHLQIVYPSTLAKATIRDGLPSILELDKGVAVH